MTPDQELNLIATPREAFADRRFDATSVQIAADGMYNLRLGTALGEIAPRHRSGWRRGRLKTAGVRRILQSMADRVRHQMI
jgi:hypothetical protein